MTTVNSIDTATRRAENPALIRVWDLGIRLYHWVQALLVTLLLATGLSGNGDQGPHIVAGLLLTVLLTWRWVWGFIGSTAARFSGFPVSARSVRRFIATGRHDQYGHNPLSAWMVLVLLFGLTAQTFSGLLMAGLIRPGETWMERLEPVVTGWHAFFPKCLLILIALHVAAAVYHGFKSDRTVTAMVDGHTHVKPGARTLRHYSPRRSLVVFLTALILVFITILLAQL